MFPVNPFHRVILLSAFVTGWMLLPLFLSGQRYNFNHFGIREGLPQSFVYTLDQDSLGYLWIGTGEGLARYNGLNFKVYTTQNGLADNFISASCYDRSGRLWVGHYQGGLSRQSNGGFETVLRGQNSSRINAVLQDKEGRIIVATQHHGLFLLHSDAKDSSDVQALEAPWLQEQQVYTMAFDLDQKTLLIGTDSGLKRGQIEGNRLRFTSEVPDLKGQLVNSITVLELGWVAGTRQKGLVCSRVSFGNHPYLFLNRENGFPERINFVKKSSDTEVWVGAADGLYQCDYDLGKGLIIRNYFGRENGLKDLNIRAFLADREGNFWLGTFGGGLVKFHNDYFNLVEGRNSLSSPDIHSIYLDNDQRLLLGTEMGLSILQLPDSGMNSNSIQQLAIKNLGSEMEVSSLCRDRNGTLWVGSAGNGLFYYDRTSDRLMPHRLNGDLSDRNINHLSIDPNGFLWVATALEGVFRFDVNSEDVVHYSTRNGLPHNEIFSVFHDRFGNTWFITQGTALAKLWQGEFMYYSRKEGLLFLDFNCMYQDMAGNYWLGTNGNGIYRFDGRAFENFTTEDGLRSNYCYAIVESQDSVLWFVSQDGISRLAPESRDFSDYSDFNQNFDLKFNTNAALADAQGNLFFGTENGLVSFRPAFGEAKESIQCQLTALTVQDSVYPLQQNFSLDYSQYRIKFDFEGVCLNHPNSVRYQYRLKGYDKDWNQVSNEKFAYYTGIDDGNYVFEVRAALPGNEFTTPSSSFAFSIKTPFWKTGWFFLISGLLGIGLIGGAIRLRTVQLQQEKRRLEGMVEERTQEIQKQTEELEQFTYAVSHDLKNPVINISGLLAVLRESQPPESEESTELFDMLVDTSNHLSSNLQKLMDVIKAKKTDISGKEEVEFETVFRELNSNIYTLISSAGARIVTRFEVNSFYFSHEHLYGFLYNLITNAIKYRHPDRQPEIRVRTFREDNFVGISVGDNGLGINLEKDREKLFGMFKRIHDHTEGSGVGLHLIKAIIEKAGGSIDVESKLDKGSTFTILLPDEKTV
ncbi:MAG: two-component regulator propeller domain-containing protein [Salibacteraceae bacterium]